MPVVDGRWPMRIAVREGLHTGEGQWALVKVVPFFASRSKFGVRIVPLYPPSGVIQSFRSSTLIISTFGGGLATTDAAEKARVNSQTKRSVHRRMMNAPDGEFSSALLRYRRWKWHTFPSQLGVVP